MGEKPDLEYITREVEKHNGVPLGKLLDGVGGLEERISIMRQIDQINATHRQKDSSLPDVSISTRGMRSGDICTQLSIDPPGWWVFNTKTLYHEDYCPHDNKRTSSYSDRR